MIPVYRSDDPDTLVASEVYGPTGARQLRTVQVGEYYYMDTRDVEWLIAEYNASIWQHRYRYLWSQVAITALLASWDAGINHWWMWKS